MTELSAPKPPVNVQVVTADDRKIPVDTRFVGYDADGIAVWEMVTTTTDVTQITMDKLPARTAVRFPAAMTRR